MVVKSVNKASAILLPSICCTLAMAGEPMGEQRRIAPPKRIPDMVSPQTLPAGEPVTLASIPKAVRRAVVADAARRFEVDRSAVVLSQAEQVTWSDGSLGCPSPGVMYPQVLVPGYRMSATTRAGTLLYHTDARGNVATCDMLPRRPRSAAPGERPTGAQPVTQPPPPAPPDR
jgi:hypothetical protein